MAVSMVTKGAAGWRRTSQERVRGLGHKAKQIELDSSRSGCDSGDNILLIDRCYRLYVITANATLHI